MQTRKKNLKFQNPFRHTLNSLMPHLISGQKFQKNFSQVIVQHDAMSTKTYISKEND